LLDRCTKEMLQLWSWEVQVSNCFFPCVSTLRQRIVAPLIEAVGDRQRLFVAPEGNLGLLSLAALPIDEDSFLLDRYEIRYLASGRDLLSNRITGSATAAAVVAAPSFTLYVDSDGKGIGASVWPYHVQSDGGQVGRGGQLTTDRPLFSE